MYHALILFARRENIGKIIQGTGADEWDINGRY